jgi:lipopolysaccharide biosynthesis glycosyltransferase
MNIVCACDANYVPHMATMLLSLVENNRQHEIRVFVLCDGALPKEEKLAAMLRRYGAELSLIPVDEALLRSLYVSLHVSKAAYARLLMGEVLPPEIDRILYLDCDLIIRGDLGELWDADLKDKTVGAVRDVSDYSWHAKLGLPPGAPYFNSGVLLTDLARWRKLGIGRQCLDFVRHHPERLTWWDQCALNLMLHEDWLPLDPRWNFQSMEIGSVDYGLIRFKQLSKPLLNEIRIVHFTTELKPWHYMNDHPLKREYLEYRRRTPWPRVTYQDRYPHNIMRRFLHRHIPPLLPVYMAARKII